MFIGIGRLRNWPRSLCVIENHACLSTQESPGCLDACIWSRVFVSFSSVYYKETLLNDIRKAREKYQGDELAKELTRIKFRMDNIEVLTSDIIINLLLSYRDIQEEQHR